MPSREEIKEGMLAILIKKYLTGKRLTVVEYHDIVNEILAQLHSQEVVIKVDREVPDKLSGCIENAKKAGYEAVEPLIKE